MFEIGKQRLIRAKDEPAQRQTRETHYGIKTFSICLVLYFSSNLRPTEGIWLPTQLEGCRFRLRGRVN